MSALETTGGSDRGVWLHGSQVRAAVSLSVWSERPLEECAAALKAGPEILAAFITQTLSYKGRLDVFDKLIDLERRRYPNWLAKVASPVV
jgi:hypothetical protein